MRVEMCDIFDVDIAIENNGNSDGEFVSICPNISAENRSDDYDICLNRDKLEEFIDALRFIAKRI